MEDLVLNKNLLLTVVKIDKRRSFSLLVYDIERDTDIKRQLIGDSANESIYCQVL